jgi:hypothetical protein
LDIIEVEEVPNYEAILYRTDKGHKYLAFNADLEDSRKDEIKEEARELEYKVWFNKNILKND